MPKQLLIVCLVVLLSIRAYSPVHAMLIKTTTQGDVLMYGDTVLGDSDEAETDNENHESAPVGEHEVEVKPLHTISGEALSGEHTQVRLKPTAKGETTVEVRKNAGDKSKLLEKSTQKRVELQFNAGAGVSGEATGSAHRPLSAEHKVQLMKLHDAVRDHAHELQLEGDDGVKSHFGQGAEIAVDPETGVVTLTTPTGKVKELKNFPSDILAKIKAHKDLEASGEAEVEVQVDADGNIKHTSHVKQKKNLFGFIPVKVDADAVVDDETGDVQVTASQETPLGKLLNGFSL